MERPTQMHLVSVKRNFKYLRGMTEFGITCTRGKERTLIAYSDSDYIGDVNGWKCTSMCSVLVF